MEKCIALSLHISLHEAHRFYFVLSVDAEIKFLQYCQISNITTNNELLSQYIYKIFIRFLYSDIYLMQWHR